MTGMLKKFYHIVAFSWYIFVLHSFYAKRNSDIPPGIFVYGGPWKYLTFLNLVRCHPCEDTFKMILIDTILEVACKCFISQVLQIVFFGLASVNDLQPVGKDSKMSLLCLSKDLLFSVFAFPVGMVSLAITC